jgi:KDO2-lipid IV(A) lauroyltransferase
MITFQHRLEFLGYRFIEKLICSLPDHSLPSFARPFAFFLYHVIGIRKKVTLDNLNIAFPEKSLAWKKKIAYNSYFHFLIMILEFMKLQRWSHRKLNSKFRLAEMEKLFPVLQQGKGAILVSGHFGNWEVAMAYLHYHQIRSTAIQQNQQNDLINQRMKALRQQWGIEIVDTRGAVKNCEIALQDGRVVALLGDQDAGHRGVFVPFFSRLASTHIGAAVLHLRTGSPLFLATCNRVFHRQFDFCFYPINGLKDNAVSDENVHYLTSRLMIQLEKAIQKYPEQYFWMHKRWKSSPQKS